MVPPLSALSLALCHEALEGGGNHKMETIRSKNHKLGSYEINKVSLSCFDDKRYILENGTNSYAYGHYLI